MIHGVVYRSEAIVPEAHVSDLDILRAALARNPGLGLTGFLIRDRWRFLQVLEGPRPAVHAMMDRIREDRRHRSVVMLASGERPRRRFGAWSMGYASRPAHGAFPEVAALDGEGALALLEDAARRQARAVAARSPTGVDA